MRKALACAITVGWLAVVTPVVLTLGQWWSSDYWGDEWPDVGTYFAAGVITWCALAAATVAAWNATGSRTPTTSK